jgi:hypothetical protein
MAPPNDTNGGKSRLPEFFDDSHNNTSREKMFFNRLYFDLKLAAAHSNYALSIFAPEVDRDGFDVSLDDGDLDRRFQLKTVLKTAGTNSWKIHKRLLRPSLEYAQSLGFPQSPGGIGLQGCFILIEIDNENDECPVTLPIHRRLHHFGIRRRTDPGSPGHLSANPSAEPSCEARRTQRRQG